MGVTQALEPEALRLRASELKQGYAIRVLKSIPRHAHGCDTVFRNGEALETCDGNFGFNPERYGGILTFCRWNLHMVYTGDETLEWAKPVFTSKTISIVDASDEWKVKNERETLYGRIRRNSDYYCSATYYYWGQKQSELAYSGLSIEDIQRQLRSFIEIVTIR